MSSVYYDIYELAKRYTRSCFGETPVMGYSESIRALRDIRVVLLTYSYIPDVVILMALMMALIDYKRSRNVSGVTDIRLMEIFDEEDSFRTFIKEISQYKKVEYVTLRQSDLLRFVCEAETNADFFRILNELDVFR